MAYYDNDTVYQTQTQALNDCYTVNSLKALAKLICDDIPTRKADLIAAITGAMAGEKIKGVFDRLDRIGQHIVAEAVFAPDGKVDYRKTDIFRSKSVKTLPCGCRRLYCRAAR